MAKNSFLSKLLGMLSKLVSGVPSFMSDFDVQASDAQIDGDIFMSQRQLVSQTIKDTTGKPLTLNISIAATNVKQIGVIADIIRACDLAVTTGSFTPVDDKMNAAMYELVGDQLEDQVSSSNAKEGSLLNPELNDTVTDLSASNLNTWKQIALGLSYDIKCECPGYPGGTIGGKSLNEILGLLSIFPIKCGAVSQEDSNEISFDANPTYLVLPILIIIQQYLKEYLDSAIANVYGKPEEEITPEEELENQMFTNDEGEETLGAFGGTNTKISIKLQKITATSDINLLGIQTDYNPGEALDVVDDILANPDFTDLLTETPQTYEVCVEDDGYDINPCDELIIHPEENLKQLFIQAIQFSRNLHMIHWLAIGNDMEKLHIKAEELYAELDEEIDLLAELIVEKTGTIIDINKIETWDTVGTQDRTFQQGIECIKQYAQSFIDYIDITYPNQPSDVQSILDDWLRYWNKQINYFITREQEN